MITSSSQRDIYKTSIHISHLELTNYYINNLYSDGVTVRFEFKEDVPYIFICFDIRRMLRLKRGENSKLDAQYLIDHWNDFVYLQFSGEGALYKRLFELLKNVKNIDQAKFAIEFLVAEGETRTHPIIIRKENGNIIFSKAM